CRQNGQASDALTSTSGSSGRNRAVSASISAQHAPSPRPSQGARPDNPPGGGQGDGSRTGSGPPRRHRRVACVSLGGVNILIYGDTVTSPAMRHEVPISIGDPFLYLETDG